jgi:hypothetical protein
MAEDGEGTEADAEDLRAFVGERLHVVGLCSC